ncbi:MAG: ankyrin repeat domain-containing protein, partial [Endozoicomonas sp. (ex Botrylloides leachii)]|nr:ankyrin repeat domain-containing protein [Endozoicomonas sp. (ex Botrylloides leachii)]
MPSTPSSSDAEFLAELKQLLDKKGADGLVTDKEGMHPLHYAAQHGFIHSVKYLLEQGDAQQLIRLKNKSQNSLVHLAAIAGHSDLLQWLANQYGKEVLLEKGHNGFTALHFAAKEGHLNCIEPLLNAAPDSLHLREDGGSCPAHWAAWAGHLDILVRVVEKNGTQILSEKGNGGNNTLCFAAQNGYLDCVQYILAMCKGLQGEVNAVGQNALHIAAENNKAEVLQWLIDQSDSEDLKATDKNGNTLLHLAAAYESDPCVEMILKYGDNLHALKNKNGLTAAHLATIKGSLDTLKRMVKKNDHKILLEKNDDAKNCLHLAAQQDKAEVMQWLIGQSDSEDLKATDKWGNNLLHW